MWGIKINIKFFRSVLYFWKWLSKILVPLLQLFILFIRNCEDNNQLPSPSARRSWLLAVGYCQLNKLAVIWEIWESVPRNLLVSTLEIILNQSLYCRLNDSVEQTLSWETNKHISSLRQKTHIFYGPCIFITAFKNDSQVTLCWAKWIKSPLILRLNIHFYIILQCRARWYKRRNGKDLNGKGRNLIAYAVGMLGMNPENHVNVTVESVSRSRHKRGKFACTTAKPDSSVTFPCYVLCPLFK
jgi:hypothetical protein